ncbi:MAG TPA: hypothetical protein VGT01_10670 [Candidatus Dormibacteraeota bacterium]|nr:hypothetical protein [Candidatus Dormibacteraeota bacterium]
MSESPSAVIGQVSADGQFRWDGIQWVPIPRTEREPTPWTRPMQLAAAGLLTVEAIVSVGVIAIYYNHDAVKKTLDAAGTQIPQGVTEDQMIGFTIAGAVGFAVVLGLIELFGALGALLRWRWIFWYVLVLMALGCLASIFGLAGLFRPSSLASSPVPIAGSIAEEVVAVAAIPMFVWMLIGVVRFGPWAMKRPGA